jgi:hypothetical protein
MTGIQPRSIRTLSIVKHGVERGLSIKEIAAEANICIAYVRALARKNGLVFPVEDKAECSNSMLDALTQAAKDRLTPQEAARQVGIHIGTLYRHAKANGIKFVRRCRFRDGRPRAADSARVVAMAALYRSGKTLQEIGDAYGVSRERVRQLLKLRDMTGKDGGQKFTSAVRRSQALSAKMQRCLAEKGCTVDQYRELRAISREMAANGLPQWRTPLRAFVTQKSNAVRRGIEWRLTVWEWWKVWEQSGKFADRGRGQGYVMCRTGDVGPYALGNVFIATARENSSTAKHKKSDLPMGVRMNPRYKSKPFFAMRMIEGKTLNLGNYSSPDLAHAAYLSYDERAPTGERT